MVLRKTLERATVVLVVGYVVEGGWRVPVHNNTYLLCSYGARLAKGGASYRIANRDTNTF